MVEQLERLDELRRGFHGGDAAAGKQRRIGGAVAGERRGVRRGDECARLALSGLQCHDPLACTYRGKRDVGKALWLANRLDEHPNCRHALIGDEGLEDVLDAAAGLVADGDHVGQVQSALLQGEIQPDVAALGDDADAALHA